MKQILLIGLFLFFAGASAQEIQVELENFDEVKVYNGLHVKLTRSQENKAVITGSSRDKVSIKVDNGILTVKTGITYLLKDDNTLITLYYKELKNLEAGQNSRVDIQESINRETIRLRAREGSYISAAVDVRKFEGSAVTGGLISVTGKAEQQVIDVKTGGEFKGENLMGLKIEVKVQGGGNANVSAKDYVDATVRAGGHIYVYGNPEQLDQQVTFGGTIKKIN